MPVGIRRSIALVVRKPLRAREQAERVGKEIRRVLQRGAFRIEADAKRRAPVNFGRLRSSIDTQGPDQVGTAVVFKVTVGAAYGKFVEFGTGPAGKRSALLPIAQQAMRELGYVHGPGDFFPPVRQIELWATRRKIPEEAVWVIARAIGRRGIPAQPFLFPAFERERPRIVGELLDAVRRAVAT
ncbi:MAG: HK97 gp10 family phage protein [Armatimonadota bacterium]|nr:HK97 gp10 family phage protein [Armatimonadota bacterium]